MNVLATQYTLANRSFEIYLAGCSAQPHCNGCFSPETWEFNQGDPCDKNKIDAIITKVKEFDNLIDHIWILGGDPADQDPQELFELVDSLRVLNKRLWLFTRHELFNDRGYLKDEYTAYYNCLHYMTFIKTGAYDIDKISENNWCAGIRLATSNQRIWTPKDLQGFVSINTAESSFSPPLPPRSSSAQWVLVPPKTNKEDSICARDFLVAEMETHRDKWSYSLASPNYEAYVKTIRRVYGKDGHCPCALLQTPRTMCMCETFRDMEEPGICHCHLYKKELKKEK